MSTEVHHSLYPLPSPVSIPPYWPPVAKVCAHVYRARCTILLRERRRSGLPGSSKNARDEAARGGYKACHSTQGVIGYKATTCIMLSTCHMPPPACDTFWLLPHEPSLNPKFSIVLKRVLYQRIGLFGVN